MSYSGYTIEIKRGLYYASRHTRTAIWKLWPKRSLREIRAAIDEHLAALSFEELVAP